MAARCARAVTPDSSGGLCDKRKSRSLPTGFFVSSRAAGSLTRRALRAARALRQARYHRLRRCAGCRGHRLHRVVNAILVDLDLAFGLQLLLKLGQIGREDNVAL